MASATWPNSERYDLLPDDVRDRWLRFLRPDRVFFPTHVGLKLDEVRKGYARLRLSPRPEILQVAGALHGGALATLIDTVAVPAIGTYYDSQPEMLTVSMTVNYVGTVVGQDAVCEGWVEKGARTLAFVRAELRGDNGELAATGSLVYRITLRS